MSSLHRRILDGFTHTQYWADLGPKTRQRMIDVVTQGRLLLPPQGVRWLSRIFNRGMTLLSIDPPVTALVSLPLTKKGANTYTTSFKDVEAGPRELWLELNSSSFVDVGAPVEPGVYALVDKDLLPGSVANFNTETITLVSSKEVRSLSTVASGGGQLNKWRQRRNKILQHYSQDRVLADFNFFASKENRGQMMEVMKSLRTAAARNKILARALDGLSFTKNGLDMPATAFGGTSGPGNCVYDTLNDLMKMVSTLEQLPQGTTILPLSGDRKWVMLDTKGSEVEASCMSHCGNKGGVEGDRLVSFRVPSKSIEGLHEPKLTFIYRPSDNSIGEMKGFANSKPDAAYHDVIVDLLSKPGFIKTIRGSGYLPERNFNLNDLPSTKLERLYKANPELVVSMLDGGDNFQRLSAHTVQSLEKLLGHSIRPSATAKSAKKSKKISNDDET